MRNDTRDQADLCPATGRPHRMVAHTPDEACCRDCGSH